MDFIHKLAFPICVLSFIVGSVILNLGLSRSSKRTGKTIIAKQRIFVIIYCGVGAVIAYVAITVFHLY